VGLGVGTGVSVGVGVGVGLQHSPPHWFVVSYGPLTNSCMLSSNCVANMQSHVPGVFARHRSFAEKVL
jgi:hypothetical protein